MDQDVESALRALQTIAGLLPTTWRPYVDLLFSAVGSLSVLVVSIKGLLRVLPVPNAPDPKAGWGQWFAYWLMYAMEVGSLGFMKPVGVSAAEVQRSKKFKIPPPMPVLALAVLLSSCATSQALAIAKVSSKAAHDVLATIGGDIMAQARADEDRVFVEHKTQDTAGPALAAVRDKWRPIEKAFEQARLAHTAMVDAINLAESTRTQPPAELAGALLAAWQSMSDAAKAAGVKLTSPPEALQALSGGVR
jgi:hypothetical protein